MKFQIKNQSKLLAPLESVLCKCVSKMTIALFKLSRTSKVCKFLALNSMFGKSQTSPFYSWFRVEPASFGFFFSKNF